jgi:hypothetical protein
MISKAGLVASVFSLTALVFIGCAEQSDPAPVMASHEDEHEHGHEHAETLTEALSELTELRDTVRDAFAKEDGDAAHGPLHDVGHLLEEVSELADEADLSDEATATIESNIETLLDAFGAVDKSMHSEDEGSSYSEVSEKIDAAIAAITAAAGPALEDDDHEGHEHGDHDEDGHEDHDEDGDHKHGDHDGHEDGDHDEKHGDDHDKTEGHDDDGKSDAKE